MFKKYVIWVLISQIFVILFSFIFYHSINLLAYINVSFVIGALLILLALTGYIINKGFFDIVFASFQQMFSKMNDEDRRPLSKLIPLRYTLPFTVGLVTIILMIIALFVYYG
ncbi:DUF3899 domain-containing protein [Heyndrickxia vini]|uniref:DUF3899 domain-containing protein n=1 Tax=Heyndrickxia vini TaxID=1476025 RepID=A0ABX7E3L2_9BACI|nr:DUF3899 domain-containing protein [Heyndrickxia vini]QQZ08947.1 DUF3899 domain-containing protein [Heyndrickxia vini]